MFIKQTFNQPLLIYNICCALYALIKSLFFVYINKVLL
ncbi:putative membrane protein [Acinetobacter sp. AR_0276]|nr:putative membrane protein [Acinetobacter sp. AR_0276]